MTYNLRSIMKRAHEIRKMFAKMNYTMGQTLRMAWQEAKCNAKLSDQDRLYLLHMKDRWDNSDYELARELERKIRAKAA